MKRFLRLLPFIATWLPAYAGNTVALSSANGHPKDTVEVTLSLENADDVVAAEFQIPLGKTLKYVPGSVSISSARANGHEISAASIDNELRIYVYNIGNLPIKGNSGELCSFKAVVGNNPGAFSLEANSILSDATGNPVETTGLSGEVTVLSPKLEVISKQIDFGHVPIKGHYSDYIVLTNSGNELLTISDISTVSSELTIEEKQLTILPGENRMLSLEYDPVSRKPFSETLAIVSDAINGVQKLNVVADPYSVNILSIGNAEGNSDETVTINISLDNMEPIVGVQCAFTLPDQLQFVDGSLKVAEGLGDFVPGSSVENNTLHLYLISQTNTPIRPGNNVVASFDLQLKGESGMYYLYPNDIVLANVGMENMLSSSNEGYVMIGSPSFYGESSVEMGVNSVTDVAKNIYTISNNSSVDLKIDKVVFLSEGFSVEESLPMTLGAWESKNLNINYKGQKAGNYKTTMNVYTNDPLNRMVPVTISGQLYEPNSISLEANKIDSDYELVVNLDNYSDIVAVQMDITCSADFQINAEKVVKTTRMNGLSTTLMSIDENTYRLLAYSFTNASISGHEGKIFSLRIHAVESQLAGEVITVSNILLSNSKSVNLSSMDKTEIELPDIIEVVSYDKEGNAQTILWNRGDAAVLGVNREPNSLIVTNDESITGYNVVRFEDGVYNCDAFELIDSVDFTAPFDFHVNSFAYDRLANSSIASFILPVKLPLSAFNGEKVYIFSEFNGSDLKFTEVTDMFLQANTPYVILIHDEGYLIPNVVNDVNVIAGEPIDVSNENATHFGSYTNQQFLSSDLADYYGYQDGVFYHAKKVNVPAYRTAISLSNDGFTSNLGKLHLYFDGEMTGVLTVDGDKNIDLFKKVDVYDATGKLVKKDAVKATCLEGLKAGVYVVDGQKLIKKSHGKE